MYRRDNVGAFQILSTTDSITITLRLSRSPGVTHTMTVHPRYAKEKEEEKKEKKEK